MMRNKGLVLFTFSAFLLAGCATGRNYQADIDALNSKIAALQGQLTVKEQEISRLESRIGDAEVSRAQAESEKRTLSEKLDSALAKAEALSRKPASSREDSDLK